jgi:nucleotide-binding universal stress UspA family protein
MNQITKILVPTDFSPSSSRACSYAIWLAAKVGASIEVLHLVFPVTEGMDFPALAAQTTKDQAESAEKLMDVFTAKALTRLQATNDLNRVPEIRSSVKIGSAASMIVEEANDSPCELIVIGTRGEHSPLEKAFGSTTTAVLKKSSVPVVVVPEEIKSFRIQRFGFASGLDESDPYRIWEATQFLAPLKPALHIVHVRTNGDKSKQIDLVSIEAFFKERNTETQLIYSELVNEDIEEGLEQFAVEHNLDLLIMYSPKRNLFERIGHRSVTRKMALYTHVPLLVMK